MDFIDILKKRRSYYALSDDIGMSEEELISKIKDCVLLTPDAFNNQSQNIIILIKEENKKFWDKVNDVYEGKIDEEKLFGFKKAYATVLFFIDKNKVDVLKGKFPKYKDNFDLWSQHANAMLQSNIWLLISSLNLGANLQHYGPKIDDMVKEDYKIDDNFELVAQMPFGKILKNEDEKEKEDVNLRVKTIGGSRS